MLRFKKPDGSEYPKLSSLSLGSVMTIQRGGSPRPIRDYITDNEDGLNWIKIGDVSPEDNTIKHTAEKIRKEGLSKTRQVFKGDLLLSNSMSFGRPYVLEIDGCIHDGWLLLRDYEETFNREFLCQLLGSEQLVKEYKRLSAGSTVQNLNIDLVKGVHVSIPCLEEQQKIADCLSSVDAVISDYEAQVENMQNQKKGVMQKLFSQEVRFKADDGSEYPEWKKYSFKDGFEIMKNNTLSRDCLNYEGGQIKNIHYGDVLIKFGSVKDINDTDVPFINATVEVKGTLLKNGDIIFADTAEDTTAGKATEIVGIKELSAVSGLHTIPCRPIDKYAEGFLGYYFNSYSYRKQLIPLMQGTKVTSLNRSNIENSKVNIPCFEEQQKIADCLSAFDTAIEDLQKTVEHWKNIKKGLLQQLFA